MTRHVIIGDGGAGTTAAYFIRQADPSARIEIYSDDPNAAYYRAALTNYLIGELREAQLFAVPPDFYRAHDVHRALGRVAAVDAKNARLTLADRSQIPYDQLLIAAGASPNPPSFPGAELAGVMTMRTLQDTRAVMDLAQANRLRQAVIIGGGPLGIEWVQGLLHHNVRVTYLLRGDVFFERALDRTASDLVISRLRSQGVDVRLNEEIAEAIGGRDGRVGAVRLKNAMEQVECQLVGAAIGIRPNVDFLQGSGIDVLQGIKVNEYMRTNVPNVYAAGDIIQRTLGLWEPARLQGRVAGRNMAGGSETYRQGAYYSATRLCDLDFAGVGEVNEKPGDQVLLDFPMGSGRVAYRKLIIREEKLVGAIMLGERKEHIRKNGLRYQKLIDNGTDISSVSKRLLDSSFDLAAWMDSQEMKHQINTARRMTVHQSLASVADIRKANPTINVALPTPKVPKAVLEHDGTSTSLMGIMNIGRHPKNDLVLKDPEVSGKHAQIRWDGSAFILKDLGSRNGTFLNGAKITTPASLAEGAQIRMGETRFHFRFILSVPEEKPTPSPASTPKVPKVQATVASQPQWGGIQVGERQIELSAAGLNIGRSPKSDVVFDDPAVSYLHAQIVCQGEEAYLRDLGSRNGTYVNGTLVSIPHPLANGDVIRLGGTSLTFRRGRAPGSPLPEGQRADRPTPPVSIPAPAPAPAPEPSLVVRAGPMLGLSFPLNTSPLAAGRDPAGQIILRDQMASWHHASLKMEGRTWFITDLGSSNGTWLNDQRLEANHLYALQKADRIRMGETLLEVT